MPKKLPTGLTSFSEIIRNNCVYVDKTKFISTLSQQKYYFLSRPRRFGKSVFLDTLKHAFLGSKELFKGTYLENNWDWSKTHPVVKISFSGNNFSVEGALDVRINEILKHCANEYNINLEDTSHGGKLGELITKLYAQTKDKDQIGNVVVLIDEYDKPILDAIDNPELAIENRNILKGFYGILKDLDTSLKFVFVTGVTKFAKAGIFSDLNNLNDITLNEEYADICGYTQNDIDTIFKDHLIDVDLAELRRWYNGYNFLGKETQKVYNPFDILLFINNGKKYQNYWFGTGTPSFLIKLLQNREYYLPQIENLVVGEELLNSFDIEHLSIETLLLQSGYLTITNTIANPFGGGEVNYQLNYPNYEVRKSLTTSLINYFIADKAKLSYANTNLANALLKRDFVRLEEYLRSFFSGIPYNWHNGNNNMAEYEGYYCTVIYSLLNSLGIVASAEDATSQGRIDLSLDVLEYRIILEFKLKKNGDAASAIKQIKDKNYAGKYTADGKPIYLVGISFDTETRNLHDFKHELVK